MDLDFRSSDSETESDDGMMPNLAHLLQLDGPLKNGSEGSTSEDERQGVEQLKAARRRGLPSSEGDVEDGGTMRSDMRSSRSGGGGEQPRLTIDTTPCPHEDRARNSRGMCKSCYVSWLRKSKKTGPSDAQEGQSGPAGGRSYKKLAWKCAHTDQPSCAPTGIYAGICRACADERIAERKQAKKKRAAAAALSPRAAVDDEEEDDDYISDTDMKDDKSESPPRADEPGSEASSPRPSSSPDQAPAATRSRSSSPDDDHMHDSDEDQEVYDDGRPLETSDACRRPRHEDDGRHERGESEDDERHVARSPVEDRSPPPRPRDSVEHDYGLALDDDYGEPDATMDYDDDFVPPLEGGKRYLEDDLPAEQDEGGAETAAVGQEREIKHEEEMDFELLGDTSAVFRAPRGPPDPRDDLYFKMVSPSGRSIEYNYCLCSPVPLPPYSEWSRVCSLQMYQHAMSESGPPPPWVELVESLKEQKCIAMALHEAKSEYKDLFLPMLGRLRQTQYITHPSVATSPRVHFLFISKLCPAFWPITLAVAGLDASVPKPKRPVAAWVVISDTDYFDVLKRKDDMPRSGMDRMPPPPRRRESMDDKAAPSGYSRQNRRPSYSPIRSPRGRSDDRSRAQPQHQGSTRGSEGQRGNDVDRRRVQSPDRDRGRPRGRLPRSISHSSERGGRRSRSDSRMQESRSPPKRTDSQEAHRTSGDRRGRPPWWKRYSPTDRVPLAFRLMGESCRFKTCDMQGCLGLHAGDRGFVPFPCPMGSGCNFPMCWFYHRHDIKALRLCSETQAKVRAIEADWAARPVAEQRATKNRRRPAESPLHDSDDDDDNDRRQGQESRGGGGGRGRGSEEAYGRGRGGSQSDQRGPNLDKYGPRRSRSRSPGHGSGPRRDMGQSPSPRREGQRGRRGR